MEISGKNDETTKEKINQFRYFVFSNAYILSVHPELTF